MDRKNLKKLSKKSLKKHYLIYVLTCLIGAFLGTEFVGSLSTINVKTVIPKEIAGNTGVISSIINTFASGNIFSKIYATINSIIDSKDISNVIYILLSLIFFISCWVLFINVYKIVTRRVFLEGRIYDKITIQSFTFLLRAKKWIKASITLAITSLFNFLWNLTIVGGIIKYYSYYLVSYIIAENPSIDALKAIKLSRDMMNGHKWEFFVTDLSFIGWNILGFITLGLSKIFYSNIYIVATFSEYYVKIREESKEKKIENIDLLNDKYLYQKSDNEILDKTYADIIEIMKESKNQTVKLTGIKGFLARNFGISFYDERTDKAYDKSEINDIKIATYKDVLDKKVYPMRLLLQNNNVKDYKIYNINYTRLYSITSLILMFFIFSFIGWLWEVTLTFISEGTFANRGVLHGPLLPIYGSGAILILTLLNKFRKNPSKEFILTVIVCGIVEYFTSVYLEFTHNGQRWWDYSGYFLNLNGRICAEGLLLFGLAGLAVVYVLAPQIDNILKKLNKKILIGVSIILISLFTIDEIYSTKNPNVGTGITTYSNNSESI